MGKNPPPTDEANSAPAVPDVARPTVSDTKKDSTVSQQDVETTSCKAGDDVDWESGVPGRKTGTTTDASQFIDFGEEKGGDVASKGGDLAPRVREYGTDRANASRDVPSPRLDANREVAEQRARDTAVDPDVGKHLEQYRAVLQLMDNFGSFDTKPGDRNKPPALTLDELKNFKSNKPEEQKAAKFAIENFAKLSGGAAGITKDSLKQPLIESLANSVKASKGSEIPPAVKEALATWVTAPKDDDEAKYLEDKINKNLEGSGKSVSISQKGYPDYAGKEVPVTTISIKSEKGTDQFSYAKTKDAKESLVPGTPIKGEFTLLETKDPAKSLGAKGPFVDSLEKFHTLKNLKQMADFSDKNHDGLFTKTELDAVETHDGKDAKAKDFANKHFQELAKTAPTGDKQTINLGDKSVAEKSPELQKDLEFLAKAFRFEPSVTLKQIKEIAKAAEANQQSPLSKGFSEYNKNTNQNRQAELDKQTKSRDSAQAIVDSFDELSKKYGGSADEGSKAGLKSLLDKKEITDPKLAAAAKEITYSGGETFSKEGIENSIKELQEKPSLFSFEKEQLDNLQYGFDNFDKLKEMSTPKEPSIQLSKVPAEGNAFLSDKNNQYGLDKDHDGRVTKAELEEHVKGLDKQIKTGTETQAEEQKLYKEAMERFKSILGNSDALVKETKGDAAGMSSADVDNAMIDALAESIKLSASENGVKLPKALEVAIHDGISNRNGKDLQAAKESLNAALKNSGYQVDLSLEKIEGPHGPTARKMTFKLIDQKNPSSPGTFSYSYDTVR